MTTGRRIDGGYAEPADNVGSGGDWQTPPELKAALYKEFNLGFDPCPYPRTTEDGLTIPWNGGVFVNPPYGPHVGEWFKKAMHEIAAGHARTVVFLIHARTDTRWFHEFVVGGAQEILFVRGRIHFIKPDGTSDSSPVPSVIVVFESEPKDNAPRIGSYTLPQRP